MKNVNTSSNFLHMSVNALKIALVLPVTVTIRSGHDPSDMLILAPDWKKKKIYLIGPFWQHKKIYNVDENQIKYIPNMFTYFFSKSFNNFSLFPNNTANFLKNKNKKD